MILPFPHLACPLDGMPLEAADGVLRCASGHAFDVSAQGHVNLLPVQFKRSRDPGDDKAMVQARRRFLNAGHYAPIADVVGRTVRESVPGSAPLACLDAGCGEGHYLRQLAAALDPQRGFAPVGLDISKWAVQSAAKQGAGTWVVGSNARLPILSGTLDCVLCLFGFPVPAEFARVLKSGGLLLQVDPGPEHLRQLREILYPTLRERDDKSAEPIPGFELRGIETLRFDLKLQGSNAVADLLVMTPHLHRATPEARERAFALTNLNVIIDVSFKLFQAVH